MGSTVKKLLRDKKKLISKHLPMMPIGKKITVMENEEKISVVSEGLLSDKAAEKIGVLTATIVYDEEKIGIVSESLMNDKAAEKIGV